MKPARIPAACALAALLSWPLLATADEGPIATGAAGDPPAAQAEAAPVAPPASAEESPEEIGAWARRVMAGRPAEHAPQDTADRRACPTRADDRPHGAVWGGVGTGGYRNVGGVVTQPLGDCGQITLGVDHTEGGGWRR